MHFYLSGRRSILIVKSYFRWNIRHEKRLSHVYQCSSPELANLARKEIVVMNDFITDEEEECLVKDIEPKWKRLKYQFDHWDNAIQGYRETEVSSWSEMSSKVLKRLRDVAFSEDDNQRTLVHVLDLAENGYIKPHVDSVRFCGRVIAGLSLLTPSVMKLVHEKHDQKHITVLLNRRSLYIMRDSLRFEYTHEILKNEESLFQGKRITKGRRLSVICRSEPVSNNLCNPDSLFTSKAIKLEPD